MSVNRSLQRRLRLNANQGLHGLAVVEENECRNRASSLHVSKLGKNNERGGNKDKLLRIGIVGTVVAAICCFTPFLVVLVGFVGLSSLIGMLDYVLLPALFIFLAITVYALWKR